MIGVFSYLLVTSFRNRLTRWLARLREPRYLVPFAVSIAWFGMWVIHPLVTGRHVRIASWSILPPDMREVLVFLGGLVIFTWIALMWILPSKQAALAFSEAELHFLFTAPVTRPQIVQYKLMQAQIGIAFGSLVSAFFFGARFTEPSGWARLLTIWLFYAIAHLHGIAASFVRTDLMEAGWSGVRRRLVTIGVALALVIAVFVSAQDAWTELARAAGSLIGADFETSFKDLGPVAKALAHAGRSGIAGVILWPFFALPRLMLANTPQEFLEYGGVGVLLLVIHYLWVVRSHTSFEEASLELSQKVAARRAARLQTVQRGGRLATRAGRFPWKLSPRGKPEIALVWKNLINLSRVTPIRALFALAAFLLLLMTWAIRRANAGGGPWIVATVAAGLIAAFTSTLGPVFLRNDLREDLFRIDTIKTMPIAGHAVLWGEVLGSWCVLAATQLALIVLGTVALVMSGAPSVAGVTAEWLLPAAGASVVVLPCLTLVAVTIQNALVVIFPAWVQLGNSRARGFEASGQRILTLFGTQFALGICALPAAASGGVAAWLLSKPMGPACLYVGAVITAAWLIAEAVIACRLLGVVLDRLDSSTAGIQPQEL